MTAFGALVWKDLLMELRSRELVTSMGLVGLLALVIQGVATAGAPQAAEALAPAVLWVTVSFAATLGLARSQALEQEYQAGSAVLLAPVDRSTVYLAKCAAHTVVVAALQVLVVAGASVLVSPEIGRHAALLAPPLLLGAVGFAVVGTLLSALALTTRLREVVLPILLLPIVLPVVIASGAAVAQVLAGARLASLGGPLRFLVAYDVLFLVLGAWLYEYAVEE